jgi:hypothetical protein
MKSGLAGVYSIDCCVAEANTEAAAVALRNCEGGALLVD